MKQVFFHTSCLLSLLGFTVTVCSPAMAQSDEACYMVTSSGQTLSLGQLCGNGTSSTANPTSPSTGVFQAPIKYRIGGIPVIDVTFGDSQTFEMIVDTGASGTVITLPMAQALQIQPVGLARSHIADGSMVDFPIGYVSSISVQGARANNVLVAIAERSRIGLLGHDFFNNYDVTIKRTVVEFRRR